MLKPLFYARNGVVFQRPVRTKTGTAMGFAVCEVRDGVDAADVCRILNAGEAPPADEPQEDYSGEGTRNERA